MQTAELSAVPGGRLGCSLWSTYVDMLISQRELKGGGCVCVCVFMICGAHFLARPVGGQLGSSLRGTRGIPTGVEVMEVARQSDARPASKLPGD